MLSSLPIATTSTEFCFLSVPLAQYGVKSILLIAIGVLKDIFIVSAELLSQ